MKTKNYSKVICFFVVGLVAFWAGCTQEPKPKAQPGLCGMRPSQLLGVGIGGIDPVPVFKMISFPSSFILDNMHSTEPKTCTLELVGPQVKPEQLFFRYGQREKPLIKVEKLAPDRVRVIYPVNGRSYMLISNEPAVEIFEDTSQWFRNGVKYRVRGGALLRREKNTWHVRALGPALVLSAHNSSKKSVSIDMIIDNASERLSQHSSRAEAGPGKIKLARTSPLALSLSGKLEPGEKVWLNLKPRKLAYPFSFVLGGDVKQNIGIFKQLLRQVKSAADPLFMLAVGDYTRNSLPTELNTFFENTRDIGIPVYFVKGNHETRAQGDAHFQRLFGPERFVFSIDRLFFAIIDATDWQSTGYGIGDAQFDWLIKKLRSARKDHWKIIALHPPPHPLHGKTLRPDFNSNLNIQEANKLKSLAVEHNVAYVVSGHAHLYARKEENGVVYLTSGGGGATLYTHNEPEGFSIDTRSHLMVFHVGLDGIEEERITLAGTPGPIK
ncbi:MAG: metallophosphoesterase [Deltaproteobacteria bacterium]|nr:metallophosphoesterase [Deltaproteobacteria bacterium]